LGLALALLATAVPAAAAGRDAPPQVTKKAPKTRPARSRTASEHKAPPAPLSSYEVVSGDTLGGIAERFGISVAELCSVNSLDRNQVIKSGLELKLPRGAVAKTKPAEKLAEDLGPARPLPEVVSSRTPSAQKADKPSKSDKTLKAEKTDQSDASDKKNKPDKAPALAKSAEPDDPSPLDVTALDKRALARSKSGPSWLAYSARPKKRGYLELKSTVGRWNGQAVVDGWTIPEEARAGIARTLASWRSGAEERIHGRLIRLLARISDQFGGRPIRIVSGFRPHGEARFTPHSKHTLGRAVDFSIPGIPNDVLRDYLRQTMKDVGVGYYPNSTHVHLDIREEDAYWVDYSSPGKPPSYGGPPRPQRTPANKVDLHKALAEIARSTAPGAAPSPSEPSVVSASQPNPPAVPAEAVSAQTGTNTQSATTTAPTAEPAVPAAPSETDSPSPHDTRPPEDP
jgi:uncharacterized protein YcbK (DUF882 family)/LysM repeat protein